MELRPYQREAVDSVYEYMRTRIGNPCVVAPTGSGKSPMIATICRDVVTRWHGRVLVLAHVKELLEQTAATLRRIDPALDVGVYSAGLGRRETENDVIVAGIQSVHKKACNLGEFDLIIVDECFVAGTMVDTPVGEIPIENIRAGQYVHHAGGIGKVECVSARPSGNIVEVRTNHGHVIRCTESHSFFTGEGWVQAGKLEFGSRLFSREDVRMLRETVSPVDATRRIERCDYCHEREALGKAAVLLDLLFEDQRESHAGRTASSEDDRHCPETCSLPRPARRERETDAGPERGGRAPGQRMGNGVCYDHDAATANAGRSIPLQNRRGEPINDGGDRTGWIQSLYDPASARGCPEDPASGGIRVESVTYLELDGTQVVYNLQVKGHPSYFADGVLVHNCHLIPQDGDGRYRQFLADAMVINPKVRLLGMTATPYRLKSGLLCGPDNLLTDVCYEIGVRDLIADGFLSPLCSRAGKHKLDCSGLHVRGGEFIPAELEKLVESGDHVNAACRD